MLLLFFYCNYGTEGQRLCKGQ